MVNTKLANVITKRRNNHSLQHIWHFFS